MGGDLPHLIHTVTLLDGMEREGLRPHPSFEVQLNHIEAVSGTPGDESLQKFNGLGLPPDIDVRNAKMEWAGH